MPITCNKNGIEHWVYEQTHVGIISTDENLNVIFINSWIEDYLHLQAEKICGFNIYQIFPDLEKKNIPSYIENSLKGQSSVLSNKFHKYILTIPLAPGEYGKLDFMQQVATISPRLNEEAVAGVIIVIENVTDRVAREIELSEQIHELELTQQSLRRSEQELKDINQLKESLLVTIPFGMDIIDELGKVLFQSENLQYIFGKEAIGQKCWELYSDNKKQCADCPLKNGIKIGKTAVYEAQKILGGKTYEVTHTGMMFQGKKALLEIFMDITERKAAEEKIQQQNQELQKINAEKDKFFSIIAHDLRGPIGSFLGLTEILVDNFGKMPNDKIQRIAVSLKNSASKLFLLLENLLKWSQMKRGMIDFAPEIQNLSNIAEETISGIKEIVENKNITISNSIPTDLQVFADKNMLSGILRNLASNAIKFTPQGGNIRFYVSKDKDSWVRISVADTGIGMSHDILENLFRLDVNVSRPGTDGEPSTGLGLLICKEFVEKHLGTIWAESEVGVGTTFSFTLKKQ